MKLYKRNCSKSAVGHFFFFSSTEVKSKNVCPIAYNAKAGAVYSLRLLTVIGWCRTGRQHERHLPKQ